MNQEIQKEISKRKNKKKQNSHLVSIKDCFAYYDKLFIVFEYFQNGSLQDILTKLSKQKHQKGLSEQHLQILLKQILLIVKEIHCRGRIIKDLKVSKFFSTSNGTLRLLDFSFGHSVIANKQNNKSHYSGEPTYLSPETIDKSVFTQKSDIWAIGIIAIIMFDGHSPYDKSTCHSDTIFRIVKQDFPLP